MIKIVKTASDKWNIEIDGQSVGCVIESHKYGGSYEATLINGIVINAFNLKSLKRMIWKKGESVKNEIQ